jgi:UDP-N-acetylmuramoyl-tripeptide--D-alanyl-D-alanine ligase
VYVKDALSRGATLALVREDWLEAQQEQPDIPCLVVPDTLKAFQAIAAAWRAQYPDLKVTGITGSVGKTTTKELASAVLGQRYKVFKSPKSYNNEYSLMPVILDIQPEHQQAVLEMGAGWDFGELRRVCQSAQPQIGVELGISHSHIGRMGTLDNLAKNKAELVESLPANGWAILNGDDHRVKAMAKVTPAQVFYYGTGKSEDISYDLWAEEVESFGLEGIAFTVHYQGYSRRLKLPLLGKHSVYNALAAAAIGLLNGLNWDEIEAGLQDTSVYVRLLQKPGLNGSTIIDDAYNASAVSMLAALDLLAETPASGRKLALLGDMLELGDYTDEAHRLVGKRAAQVVNHLVVVGELGQKIGHSALENGLKPEQVSFAPGKSEAAQLLSQTLQASDLLLVKASRGMALEDVITKLSEAQS